VQHAIKEGEAEITASSELNWSVDGAELLATAQHTRVGYTVCAFHVQLLSCTHRAQMLAPAGAVAVRSAHQRL
jgi:hypothetical protein